MVNVLHTNKYSVKNCKKLFCKRYKNLYFSKNQHSKIINLKLIETSAILKQFQIFCYKTTGCHFLWCSSKKRGELETTQAVCKNQLSVKWNCFLLLLFRLQNGSMILVTVIHNSFSCRSTFSLEFKGNA